MKLVEQATDGSTKKKTCNDEVWKCGFYFQPAYRLDTGFNKSFNIGSVVSIS
jgi:hypothetical protein